MTYKPLIFSLFSLFMVIASASFGQNTKAYLNYNQFYSPTDGSYIETYTAIDGSSLHWKNIDNKLKSDVELTIIFRKDSQIVNFSKEIIHSAINDSSAMQQLFMHTNRYRLKQGNYDMGIKINDLNDTVEAFFVNTPLTINNFSDSIKISSIEAFTAKKKDSIHTDISKSGYLFTPNIFNFYSPQDSLLKFYAEIYNTDKVLGLGNPYIVTYSIINAVDNKLLPKYRQFKRLTSRAIQPLMSQINITDLPSSNFLLVVEVRDKNNKLRAQQDYIFQKQSIPKPMKINNISSVNITSTFVELITGVDTLAEILRSLTPISSEQENEFANQLINDSNAVIMQQYLYNFWQVRKPDAPLKAFSDYMTKVRYADKVYGTRLNRGYATDRGRVYLQYGKPNSIARDYHDPSAFPYEIWHYYQARGQRNIKFIFYNTDLASNEFYLLHSTAIGEINDYQWRIHIKKRNSGFHSIDDEGGRKDDWGSNLNRHFQNPR